MAPIETGLSLIFDALSNRTRRQIILALGRREGAGFVQIMKEAGLDPASDTGHFSYHLSRLREWGLLERTRDGYCLTRLGRRAAGLLEEEANPGLQPSSMRGGGHDMEIVEMGEKELSELAEAVFGRMDEKERKHKEEVGKALGIAKDFSQWVDGWKKNRKHWIFGTVDPTPDRVGIPDAWVSRALSLVAKRNGKIIGALFPTEYPAKKLPASLGANPSTKGWGIIFEHTDRPTHAEKLLSGDVGGVLGREGSDPSWIDPDEDYEVVWEALAKHAIQRFRERGAKFVQIEKRFSTESEVGGFEAMMNRLGLVTSLKDHRVIMGTAL